MRKIGAFSCLLLLFFTVAETQSFDYGNGWYLPSQPWLKIVVAENGIYRVNAADLVSAGWDTSGMDADRLQLYFQGREQHIALTKSGTALDHFEFYGQRNDGYLDSMMYRNPYSPLFGKHDPSLIPNRRYSLFTDSAAYWLTYSNAPGLRYQEYSNTNYSAFTPQPYFRYEAFREFIAPYFLFGGQLIHGGGSTYDSNNVLNSDYNVAEGYFSRVFGNPLGGGLPLRDSVATPGYVSSGTAPQVRARIATLSSNNHLISVTVNGSPTIPNFGTSNVTITTLGAAFTGVGGPYAVFQFDASAGQPGYFTDNNAVSWYSFTYNRTFDLQNGSAVKMSDWNQSANTLVAFDNCAITSAGWIYDLTTHTRIHGLASLDSLKAIVPGSASSREMFVVTDQAIRTPVFYSHNLANLKDPSAGAEFIIITQGPQQQTANAYRDYRASNPYNQMSARVVLVEQIYDEFSYGSVSPMGIKRFCKYALDNWAVRPKYFLLWGKGLYDIREGNPSNTVMTWGYPATDFEFVSNFHPDSVNQVPIVPIGRVSVTSQADGENYLEKVMIYEASPWDPWMKEGLFLGGGESGTEQTIISTYQSRSRANFRSPPFLGFESYQQKTHSGLVSNFQGTTTEKISAGLGLIHFFGHSASNQFEIDIKEPYNYTNWEKFPLVVAFGCYGGDFTVRNPRSFGESFLFEKRRGAIGYLANSTAGYPSSLGIYGDTLFPHIYGDMLGQPIGAVIKKTLEGYLKNSGQDIRNHAHQLNYQGDPSLVLYHPEKPDIELSSSGFYLSPENYSAGDSVFDANIIVRNLGLYASDSFYVSIRQQSPVGFINHPTKKYGPTSAIDTLPFQMSNIYGALSAGMNFFDVFVDSDSTLDEYDEDNNRYTFQVFIPGNVPAILYPYEYAVIDSNGVRLLASASAIDTFDAVHYLFEIDTVPEFNSNMYRASNVLTAPSWLAGWNVPFILAENQVYYWRVRLADYNPPIWVTSSFKFMPGRTGWAQSRPPQFFKDPTDRVEMNQTSRFWEFKGKGSELHAWVKPGDVAEYRMGIYRSVNPAQNINGVMYCAIDKNTLIPRYLATPSSGGTGNWAFAPMPFGTAPVTALINSMEHGDYFLMVSHRNPYAGQWSLPQAAGFRAALESVGCSNQIASLQDGQSLIILGKKGYPGWAKEIFVPNRTDPLTGDQILDLNYFLRSSENQGNVFSTTVGPAVKWTDMFWNWSSMDQLPDEHAAVSVYTPSVLTGNDSLVLGPVSPGTYSLSSLNAAIYPTLRLVADVSDSVAGTPPQLDHWHVIYDPAPEAVVNLRTGFSFHADTLLDGEPGWVQLNLQSITPIDFSDSMLVRYSFEDAGRNMFALGEKRFPVLNGNSTYDFRFDYQTLNRSFDGRYKLIVEVNPDNDQHELYHFNNFFARHVVVVRDKINPVMDVTFDGKHILNNDLVSPAPEILIQVNDENQYYAVSDTSIELYFGPVGNVQRIFIDGNVQIQKQPGTVPGDNKMKITFNPGRLEDGFYTFRVQGFDKNGNMSGKEHYEVDFEVVNESSVSEVLNYPNPFSTCTRWVYTLTGAEKPDVFKIQVFTVTGKFVKEVDLLSEGEVHPGYNISEYCWDGRDEFGDLLANGVYVYRVICKKGEDEIRKRDEGISEFFKNGYGKLYIMR